MAKYSDCGNCHGTGRVTTVFHQPVYAGNACRPAAKVAKASSVPCSCCQGKGRFIEAAMIPGGGGIGNEPARRLI